MGWDVSVLAAQEWEREAFRVQTGLLGDLWVQLWGLREGGNVLGSPNQPCLFCRYTFGSALFVGWVAGGLALVGGIMMCLACKGLIPEESR